MPSILLERGPDGVAVLTINRPEVRNALNWEAMDAFSEAVDSVASDPDVRNRIKLLLERLTD